MIHVVAPLPIHVDAFTSDGDGGDGHLNLKGNDPDRRERITLRLQDAQARAGRVVVWLGLGEVFAVGVTGNGPEGSGPRSPR